MLKNNSDKISLLRGLLSTLSTVTKELECTGECEECYLEYQENSCLGSDIATLSNRIANMEGV